MVRIFIVEDHPVMRRSLQTLLAREPDLVVSGAAANAESALEQIEKLTPDLVLIDVSLPGMNGIELARTLRALYPDVTLSMLSGHDGKTHVEQALKAGASGYILKGRASELPAAIRQLASGEQYVSLELQGEN